nr:MAG TPA: hypothetical protein [Caudoviricetes sp.]
MQKSLVINQLKNYKSYGIIIKINDQFIFISLHPL